MNAAAVRQASIDHGRRFVDTASDLTHDLVDDPPEMMFVGKPHHGPAELSVTLKPHVVWPIDHHLGDRVVVKQALDGAMTEGVVCDLLNQTVPICQGHTPFLSESAPDIR